ncbi:MAG: metal-dependent transcriptional regulator [Maioricimonas sp. JB049]
MSEVRRTRPEDYLAAIDRICKDQDRGIADTGAIASTGAIAMAVGVSKGTVSAVLKELAEAGLVEHVRYRGAKLTETGRQKTRRTLRRCRLIELFLSQTLNVAPEVVADDARQLEPAISERLIEQIDRVLGHPATDVHDPSRSPC